MPEELREVGDEEVLLRRISYKNTHEDGTLTRAAFNDPNLSVDREALRSRDETAAAYPYHGLASFTAGEARVHADVVAKPSRTNIAHAEVQFNKAYQVSLDRFGKYLRDLASKNWDPAAYLPLRERARTEALRQSRERR